MGNSSKAKGTGYERELVQQALAAGLDAKRAWGSNGESLGLDSEVDLVVEGFTVQAKRRKMVPEYLKPSPRVDMQAIREDRGRTLVVVDYFDLLDLLKLARQGRINEADNCLLD